MATIIQSRRDTSTNWASINPVLADGELGIETDTKKFKFGDGVTAWNSLGYSAVATLVGLTASVNELNVLDGITANTTELNCTDGVTGNIQTQFDNITEKIPAQATSSNKLADKNFVNSSIATNTANFIGTFNSVAELEAYSGTVTNNDYAFVVGTDSDGNTIYNRYKYTTATTPASWVFEYALNNSSFTSAQWSAINSGATTTNIGLAESALQSGDNISLLTNDAGYIDSTNVAFTNVANTFTKGQKITRDDAGAILELESSAQDTNFLLTRTGGSQCVLESGGTVGIFGTKSSHPLQIRAGYVMQFQVGTNGIMTSRVSPASNATGKEMVNAEWVLDKNYTANSATGTDSVGIGTGVTSADNNSVAIGKNAQTGGNNGVAIGQSSKATYGSSTAIGSSAQATASAGNAFGTSSQASGTGALAVGYGAKASATYAIQLGYGTNSTANTLSVGLSSSNNYQLLDSTGTIPSARLPYTSTNDAGAIKLSPSYYGTDVGSGVQEGRLTSVIYSYAGYANISNLAFISKGTLENVLTGKGLYQRSVYDGTKAIDSGSIALENSTVFYTDSPSANTTYTIDSTALTQTGFTCRYFNVLINMPSTAVALDFTTNNTVVWAEGETPDMSTGGRTYLLAFQTFDSGTTWVGSLCTWWETPSA